MVEIDYFLQWTNGLNFYVHVIIYETRRYGIVNNTLRVKTAFFGVMNIKDGNGLQEFT